MIEVGSSMEGPDERKHKQFEMPEETSKSGADKTFAVSDTSQGKNVAKDSANFLSGDIPGFSLKPPDLDALREQEQKKALAKAVQPSVQQFRVANEVTRTEKGKGGLQRFTDGEEDIWPSFNADLKRLDNLSDATYNKQLHALEKDGASHINTVVQRAIDLGVTFMVTPPEEVNIRRRGNIEAVNDIWAHTLNGDFIQVPRHVLSQRPTETGEPLVFRPEVPSSYIIVNMAHEVAHVERKKADRENYDAIYKNKVPSGQRENVVFGDDIKAEELATDVHAYKLLKEKDVPITPAVYVAQVPNNDAIPTFREELLDRLQKEE